jgi:hypothetical protein
MGGRDSRPAGPRALADGAGAPKPAGSAPGAAAAAQRPAAGLVDALHGAPALLAAVAVAAAAVPGDRPSLALRLVSKACCEAVDAAATRITLAFQPCVARQQAGGRDGGAWLAWWMARMDRRLAKVPRLQELTCTGPSEVELGQLLAGPVAAGVQRLDVRGCTSGRSGPGDAAPRVRWELPASSLAHLPSLQVWLCNWLPPFALPRHLCAPSQVCPLRPCILPCLVARLLTTAHISLAARRAWPLAGPPAQPPGAKQ